jgi:hypothetical protein
MVKVRRIGREKSMREEESEDASKEHPNGNCNCNS